jgi:hypothetical protein
VPFIKQFLAIATNEKSFVGIIGNPLANRLGLHVFRILVSNVICKIRTAPFFFLERRLRQSFAKDGVVVLENFLDEAAYLQVKAEIYQVLDKLPPAPVNTERGFGKRISHPQGFDRYDGGTLNRFASIEKNSAIMAHLVKKSRLSKLTLALFGLFSRSSKYSIYELRHGDEASNPDIQKQLHKDTFHHTYKLWYFVDEVTYEQGPFAYSVGSHRSTLKSLQWEYQMSCTASSDKDHPNRGGSFRVTTDDLQQMAFPALKSFQLPANTLVIANTKGFHQRAFAEMGARRISIYANFRPLAFLPFAI